jgi:hypothetical protein
MSDHTDVGKKIRFELKEAHSDFENLLGSVTADQLMLPSHNPGWSNGELMAHMLFGFIIVRVLTPLVRIWGLLPRSASRPFAWLLNLGTRPFNWFNALGARLQGRVFTLARLQRQLEATYRSLVITSERIGEREWQRGMHMPSRWDPNFADHMTLEDVFHYPVAHFRFHLSQLAHLIE